VSAAHLAADVRTVRHGAALVVPAHELLWVRGRDAISFLEGLLSQSVESAPVGSVRRTLLLSPQGRLVSPLWMLRDQTRVGLVGDPGAGEAVLETLQRFRFRVDVSLEYERLPTAEVWGPDAAAAVGAASGIEALPGTWVGAGASVVTHLPFRHIDLPRWLIAGIDPMELVAAGISPVEGEAAAAVRIEAGEPLMGVDVGESTIPQEAGLTDGAVDFTKGCYLGQELVARIESRGHVNRHLRGLLCAEGDTPPPGAALSVEGRQVGTITSAASSPGFGVPVGLGFVRREVGPGAAVAVDWGDGGTTAIVRELPFERVERAS
jgi:folate-binding protein YgfZ